MTDASPGPPRGRTSLREGFAVCGLYALLTVAMSWPMAANMRHTFAKAAGDVSYAMWNIWWSAEALASGKSLFHSDAIYHPEGCSLVWRQLEPFLSVPLAPITWAFGAVFAYNFAFLLSFVLAGLTAYLLVKYLTGSPLAAFGAGLVFSFQPLQFITYPTLSYAHIQWLPLVVLCVLKLRDTGKLRHGVWAGFWLSFLFLYSSIYYGVYAGLAVALFGAWYLLAPSERVADRRRWLLGLAACYATTVAIIAFRFVPMALEAGGDVETEVSQHNYADLFGFTARVDADHPRDIIGWPAVLGYVALVGAALGGIGRGWKRARLWWLTAAVFFAISLGSILSVAGREFKSLPMPVDILRIFPLLSSLRVYVEAIVVVVLAIAVLFGFFLQRLEERAREAPDSSASKRLSFASVAVLVLLLTEYWPATPVPYPDSVPEFYTRLAAEPEPGAILSIPFNEDVSSRAPLRAMFLQTQHGLPIVSGHVGSRYDPRRARPYLELGFMKPFYERTRDEAARPFPIPDEATAARFREELRGLGVGAVVLYPQYIVPAGEEQAERGRNPFKLRLPVMLAPVWWGPIRREMIHPPESRSLEKLYEPGNKQRRLHASVREYLQAVLGPPQETLEDGGIAWRVPAN